jgi:hypothetical protein
LLKLLRTGAQPSQPDINKNTIDLLVIICKIADHKGVFTTEPSIKPMSAVALFAVQMMPVDRLLLLFAISIIEALNGYKTCLRITNNNINKN